MNKYGSSCLARKVTEEVTREPEIPNSVYSFLEKMRKSIKGEIKIFPDYCIMDETYKMAVNRDVDFCVGCGELECIGHTSFDGLRSEKNQEKVDEWKKYREGRKNSR